MGRKKICVSALGIRNVGELLHVSETHAYKEKGDKLAPSLVSMMPLLELGG